MNRLKYYFRVAKWLFQHRNEKPCRQKFRRMDRELMGTEAYR